MTPKFVTTAVGRIFVASHHVQFDQHTTIPVRDVVHEVSNEHSIPRTVLRTHAGLDSSRGGGINVPRSDERVPVTCRWSYTPPYLTEYRYTTRQPPRLAGGTAVQATYHRNVNTIQSHKQTILEQSSLSPTLVPPTPFFLGRRREPRGPKASRIRLQAISGSRRPGGNLSRSHSWILMYVVLPGMQCRRGDETKQSTKQQRAIYHMKRRAVFLTGSGRQGQGRRQMVAYARGMRDDGAKGPLKDRKRKKGNNFQLLDY